MLRCFLPLIQLKSNFSQASKRQRAGLRAGCRTQQTPKRFSRQHSLHNLCLVCKASNSMFQGSTAQQLTAWLEDNGVDISLYGNGVAKTIVELLEEAKKGEASLSVKDGKPVRFVTVLNVAVMNADGQVLVEEKQVLPDGRPRFRGVLLSEKLMDGEDWAPAVLRAVQEELGSICGAQPQVTVHAGTHRIVEESRPSPSYPGLFSFYRIHKVQASVAGLPNHPFSTTETRPAGILQTFWVWKELEDCWKS